eukprot:maker-scaffold206_size259025-snap-gene-0.9 protein:Tk10926 transcript:maker-scaffold206_size259025-snap-gene-0.9-mRNA-1 annotation:"low quality protein: zinc finger protein 705a-like"
MEEQVSAISQLTPTVNEESTILLGRQRLHCHSVPSLIVNTMSTAIPWSHGGAGPSPGDHQERDAINTNPMLRLERRQPSPARFFIDGPGRLSNALQLMTSALNSVSSLEDPPLPPLNRDTSPPPNHSYSHHNHLPTHFNPAHDEAGEEEEEEQHLHYLDIPTIDEPTEVKFAIPDTIKAMAGKTIVASDNEVSNGFVKDGKMLPYVFEANEAGTRKRSSKILPVCGVCGKRFVCVTTMKRHLVTHTGEKPFACKICGKQYTQKGNLRVHERTHRNDRPFECNICHQKFYRKEPMQKHQWRQHGVVHFKSRPLGAPCDPVPTPSPIQTTVKPPVVSASEGVLYNSIVDQIKNSGMESYNQDSRSLNGPPPPPTSSSYMNFHQAFTGNKTPLSMAETSQPEDLSSTRVQAEPRAESPKRRPTLNNTLSTPGNRFSSLVPKLSPSVDQFEEFKHAKLDSYSSHSTSSVLSMHHNSQRSHLPSDYSVQSQEPTPETASNLSFKVDPPATSPNSKLLDVGGSPIEAFPEDKAEMAPTQSAPPMKLKKLLAHAYQKEVEEQQLAEEEPKAPEEAARIEKEMVECQCKACGHVFTVLDPYNFRCSNCNAKYTSLPTHMIADPLQCIGCCQVFPHKPALKAHQLTQEKERPFRCCKCGYGFRQKAHLQKHQWRIHRRKLEPDPSMKEAEAIFQAMKNVVTPPKGQSNVQSNLQVSDHTIPSVTVQEITDHGREDSLSGSPDHFQEPRSPAQPEQGMQPLDLSPTKAQTLIINVPVSSAAHLPMSPSSKPVYLLRVAETNPLLNQQIPLPVSPSANPNHAPLASRAWKKQRTCSESSNPDNNNTSKEPVATHRTLPQIATLQPPSLGGRSLSSALSPNSFKHSAWLSGTTRPEAISPRQYSRPYSMPNMSTSSPTDGDKPTTTTEATHMVRHDLMRDLNHDIRTV